MELIKLRIKDVISEYGNITCLIPIKQSIEEYKTIKNGEVINVKWDYARNLKHHRLFFAILKTVCDNLPDNISVESLLIMVKYEIGWVKTVKKINGEEIVIPKSIDFATIGEKTFTKKIFEPSLDLFEKLGFKREALLLEAAQ
jgi:hypothetical protein